MNKRILTQFVAATAGITLPLSIFAQDISDQSNSGNLDTSAVTSGSADQSSGSSGSYSSGGTFSSDSNQSSQQQSGMFNGGIMVHKGKAYIVHQLQNEMSLPNGSKVQPNGTIRESDGSTKSISSGKVLTLDGQMMDAPFGSGNESSSSNSPGVFNSPNTPGASTGIGGTSNPPESPSSGVPPTPSTTSGGLGSPTSTSGTDSNTSTNPVDQSDGSGLAPGSISTDPGQDYTD